MERAGMGRGSGSGSGIFRSVERAVTRPGFASANTSPASPTSAGNSNAPRPNHKSTSSNVVSLSSGYFGPVTPCYQPFYGASGCDDFEWVSGKSSDGKSGEDDDDILRSPPSTDEIEKAVADLQMALSKHTCNSDEDVRDQVSRPTGSIDGASRALTKYTRYDEDVRDQVSSPTGSIDGLDWQDPSLQPYDEMKLPSSGVDDALHLMRRDPFIQRMATSLAGDPALWAVVMNNETVKEVKEMFYSGYAGSGCVLNGGVLPSSDDNSGRDSLILDEDSDGSNGVRDILGKIFDCTKGRMSGLVEKISKLMCQLFRPASSKSKMTTTNEGYEKAEVDPFMQKVACSFTICIMLLLTVALTRAQIQTQKKDGAQTPKV